MTYHSVEYSKQDANAIRALAMDAVEKAKSGHPGMPMGMADVASVLFRGFLKFDAADPHWPDRDRFVLSAGHGSMLLYALGYLVGYPGLDIEDLKQFRQLGSKTAGHPEYGHAPGVETTTGPLGQGLATAVGMAIGERLQAARFGDELVDHFTYVLAGDGCLMEGVSHEAIDLAGHLRLGKLIVLWDDNSISIDGPTSLATSTDQAARFRASGWHVQQISGHDFKQIAEALTRAKNDPRPSMIACRTMIGYGAPGKEGKESAHGAPLGSEQIAAAREKLGWRSPPFEVPEPILAGWRKAGARGARSREAWRQRLANSAQGAEFERFLQGDVAGEIAAPLQAFREQLALEKPKVATRKSSEMTLGVINGATRATIGGSADLTHSNYTITKGMGSIAPGDFSGRYIHYGVREFGMAAAMNGISLHGGFAPYGGTFLVFSDYARAAIRLAALMGVRAVYVLTHDFDRPWRGRADASACRASRQPARHAEPQRLPPRRRDRDRRMLGAGARREKNALRAEPLAPEPADLGAPRRREPFRARSLCVAGARRRARRDPAGHGLGGGDRARSGEAARSARQARGGRLHAELRAVFGAAGRLSRLGAGNGAARRRRGRHTLWLGPLAWREKRLRRHDRLWRERARRGAV